MKAIRIIGLISILAAGLCASGQKTLLTGKHGSFRIIGHPLNSQGADHLGRNCACSQAEASAMMKKMENFVAVFRQCPVLKDPMGYDGSADISGGRCSSKFGYGVPVNVYYFFKSWELYKGRELQWKIEPPQWRMEINQTEKFCSNGFNETDFSNTYNPSNPAFSESGMSKATRELREIFFTPGVREQVRRGIDRYGVNVILYNPDRPPYWDHVTIREAFRLLINYWKCVPDIRQAEATVPLLNLELASYSEADKDGYAYFGNPETVSRIGSVPNDTPVMRPNPAYWDKHIPASSIQFVWFEMPSREVVRQRLEQTLKSGDGYYYVWRLRDELDVESLLPLIGK